MKFRLFILLLAPILTIPIFIPILDDAFTADWYNNSWEQRKKITTSLNTVISSDLTDFPALISFTDSDLTQTTESDGTDIVFTASDGTTELAYEIERFDQSTGEVIAWVKIPTVSASDNTDIYLYYKGTATSSSSSVWDSSYKLVWHLNQTSTGTVDEFTDVSDTGNDGTGGGTGVGVAVGVGTVVAVGIGTEVGVMAAIAVAATAVDMMELVVLVADIAAAMVASTFGVAVGSESVEDLTTALFV